jgi:hypothetical protein
MSYKSDKEQWNEEMNLLYWFQGSDVLMKVDVIKKRKVLPERNYADSVFAFTKSAQSVRFNEGGFFEILSDSGAKNACALAVNNGKFAYTKSRERDGR